MSGLLCLRQKIPDILLIRRRERPEFFSFAKSFGSRLISGAAFSIPDNNMNFSFKTLNNAAGWLTFAIAATVLGLAAEPTGSLWDCGEFISWCVQTSGGTPARLLLSFC
jgi:hypothetical protein